MLVLLLLGAAEAPAAEEPLLVHWSQVKPRRRCRPKPPRAASGECTVRWFVDEAGAITDHRFEDCPEPLREPIEACADKARFKPFVDSQGQVRAVQFDVTYAIGAP